MDPVQTHVVQRSTIEVCESGIRYRFLKMGTEEHFWLQGQEKDSETRYQLKYTIKEK